MQPDNREIYLKIAECAAKVFDALVEIERRTYTASELSKFTQRNKDGKFICKDGAACMFRRALDEYEKAHCGETFTVSSGTFECELNAQGIWYALARFEALARIPKSEQTKFTFKPKSKVLYRLKATLPKDAGIIKSYVSTDKGRPRLQNPCIDITNGWMWASDTHTLYGGRCEATLEQGSAGILAITTRLAAKFAGQSVSLTYYDDGTLECNGEIDGFDNSSLFDSNMPNFKNVIPKVNKNASVKLGKEAMDKLRKFMKTAKTVEVVTLGVDGDTLKAWYTDCNMQKCIASMKLERSCDYQIMTAFSRPYLTRVLKDCSGEIWLNDNHSPSIFEAKDGGSFMMAMPSITEETRENNNTVEKETEYLTLKTEKIMANKTTETPLMKQYFEMKKKKPDAILLFRIGDFYETFKEDAVVCSEILGLTLTRRANGTGGYVELAGFPYHALDTYLPKLVRAGKRVAICEQLDDKHEIKTEEVKAEEVKAEETQEEQPKADQTLRDELRECALSQIPHGAEIVASKYVPIGDDNGKWQLIMKMGDTYRYADIVGAARYLYLCERTFAAPDDVATLMGIPLALPQPKADEQSPKTDEQQSAVDEIVEMKKMFMDEYGKSAQEASVLTESNYELKERLVSEKNVGFRFRKKDGSERIAHGTLHPDVIPEVKESKREPNPKFQTYYDLEKQQWRCFEKVNLIID